MYIFEIIAENKIREAILRGELENLPGQGKPLNIGDLSHVPEELRAGYIVLKTLAFCPKRCT